MHKICAINIRPEDIESIPFIVHIIDILEKKGIKVHLPDYKILKEAKLSEYIVDQERFVSQSDIVISVGGDGTLLHTAHLFTGTGKPIFGINKGRLGFLTEFMPDEAISYLDRIISKEYEKSERDMLELVQTRDQKEVVKMSVLNDVAISRGTFSRPITINLDIDGKYLNSFSGGRPDNRYFYRLHRLFAFCRRADNNSHNKKHIIDYSCMSAHSCNQASYYSRQFKAKGNTGIKI